MSHFLNKPSATRLVLCTCVITGAILLGACSSREDRARSYYNNGVSYIEKQDFVKARIELRNALQQKPEMIEAWRAQRPKGPVRD